MTARSLVLIVVMVACGFAWHSLVEERYGKDIVRLPMGADGKVLRIDCTMHPKKIHWCIERDDLPGGDDPTGIEELVKQFRHKHPDGVITVQ